MSEPISDIQRLVRSNFILSRIRSGIPDSFPFFVKWDLIGAFNGAVLGNSKTSVQILCYSTDQTINEEANIKVTLPSMIVSGVWSDAPNPIDNNEFSELVLRADTEFDATTEDTNPLLVRNLLALFNVNPTAADFARKIGQALSGDVIPGTSQRFSLVDYEIIEMEFQVRFPQARLDSQVATDLNTLFSAEFRTPLYGFGSLMPQNEFAAQNGIEWGHVFTRHF